jgi:hypothetical protein
MSRFPAAFRPPAFASWVLLPPLRIGPSSRSAYRVQIRTRTSSGLSRYARARYDRVGRPLYPGTAVFSRLIKPPQPAPAASQRPVLHPHYNIPSAGLHVTRNHQGFTLVRPFGLPLHLWLPDGTRTLGLNHLGSARSSYPQRTPGWGQAPEHWPRSTPSTSVKPPHGEIAHLERPRVARRTRAR